MNKEFKVGEKAFMPVSSEVYVEVKVLQVKRAYGHTRYLVEPVAGKGQMITEKLIPIK